MARDLPGSRLFGAWKEDALLELQIRHGRLILEGNVQKVALATSMVIVVYALSIYLYLWGIRIL
jgi:hypothetical protein